MKFELSTENIVAAVRASVLETVNLKPGQTIDIKFTNGRGDKGVTATAEIVSEKATAAGPLHPSTSTTTTVRGDAEKGPVLDSSENAASAPVERLNGKVVEKATDSTGNAGEAAQAAPVEASGEPAAKPGLFATL